jgi:D-psicose/D-tagatose/L-ribulose 3-epimerase
MNSIGIHYGCFVTNWMDEQLELINKVGNLGFEVFEMGCGYLLEQSDKGLKQIRDCAQQNNVQLIMSLGMAPEHDISSSDNSIRTAGIRALGQMADVMDKCGISDCCGVVYCEWNRTAGSVAKRDEAWKNSLTSMKEAVKPFEDKGVFLNLEPTNRFENSLINCCDQALEYIDIVGSPNIGVHLDTFHINIEEDSFVAPILKAGNKLRYFHVGENNRKMPGTGFLPWKTIFDALKSAAYSGPIVMEPFVRPVGEIGPSVSLYREVMDLGSYEEDLKLSLSFIRSLLK